MGEAREGKGSALGRGCMAEDIERDRDRLDCVILLFPSGRRVELLVRVGDRVWAGAIGGARVTSRTTYDCDWPMISRPLMNVDEVGVRIGSPDDGGRDEGASLDPREIDGRERRERLSPALDFLVKDERASWDWWDDDGSSLSESKSLSPRSSVA